MLDLTVTFAAFPVIETERFLLRAVTLDDVADMFRVMSDPLSSCGWVLGVGRTAL